MKITLRPATSEDLEALYNLDQRIFPPHIRYDMETFVAAHMEPLALVIVAEVDGAIAGFVIAIAEWDKAGAIITIDIEPAFQRRGVGTKLMAEAHEKFIERGVNKTVLNVAVENKSAISFYEKLGYQKSGTIKGYYSGVEDAYTMEKVVARPQRLG